MNDNLILKSLRWIIENTSTRTYVAESERTNLLIDINKILNPPRETLLEDKTKEAFGRRK